MFFVYLVFVQLAVFAVFFTAERCYPHHTHPIQTGFSSALAFVCAFAAIWSQVLFVIWLNIQGIGQVLPASYLLEGGLFYLVYSLVNYWAHRLKHAWYPAWYYLHNLHHSPSHMDSRIAFYRHPLEIMANTVVLLVIGKVLFDVSAQAVAMALVIEGCLETFHHANIRLQKRLKKLGYVIQTPEQHLLHHEKGKHKSNYSPLTLWDTVFKTVAFSNDENMAVGFNDTGRAWPYLRFKK